MLAQSDLDVVIVSHNCRELLRACLESVVRTTGSQNRIIVIDNASEDGTPEDIRENFPELGVVSLTENLGFAVAANIGIRRGGGPYVLVLNPDTTVSPEAVEPLLSLLDERPEIGICGPKLLRADGTFDHAARRSFPTITGALGHFTGLGRRARAPQALAQYRAPELERGPVDAVNGAFMLIRRKALEDVGLFDEGYWMYMEDLDLCYRFAQAGWVTWYEPSSTVLHVKHGCTGPVRAPRLTWAFHYGMYRFYRRHYAEHRSRVVNAAVYTGIWIKLGASLAAGVARQGLRAV
jgi:hypothetical protein